jgi:DnaJ-class molecular chaperone
MDLDIIDLFSEDWITLVKKQYKKFALINHPDKNNSTEAAINFIKLNEARNFLQNKSNIETITNHYLEDNFAKHFPFADHSANHYMQDSNIAKLFGEVFAAFDE